MFSRTSLNSLLKVFPMCQGKENWNLLSHGMHMLRDFHIPRDIHLSRGAHTVGHAMSGDDACWLFNLQPSFLADSFCNSPFYFHRETIDKLVHEWLERAGMPKVREWYLLQFHSLTKL